jgi:hypothetical protein
MSQNNIVLLFPTETVAEDLACVFAVCTQLFKTPKDTHTRSIAAATPPFEEVNYVDVSVSNCLMCLSFQPQIRVSISGTFSQSRQVGGSGSILIARQSECHAIKSVSAPNHSFSSSFNAFW